MSVRSQQWRHYNFHRDYYNFYFVDFEKVFFHGLRTRRISKVINKIAGNNS